MEVHRLVAFGGGAAGKLQLLESLAYQNPTSF